MHLLELLLQRSGDGVDLDLNVYMVTSETPAMVTGLLNSVTYEITVAAANDYARVRRAHVPGIAGFGQPGRAGLGRGLGL